MVLEQISKEGKRKKKKKVKGMKWNEDMQRDSYLEFTMKGSKVADSRILCQHTTWDSLRMR